MAAVSVPDVLKHPSATVREAHRARWRSFVLPHWPRLKRTVLDDQEAIVLSLRLGLVNDRAVTHAAIARRLDCSSSRVSVIEHSAMRKVRSALNVKEISNNGTPTS